jgi:hypothetical protein
MIDNLVARREQTENEAVQQQSIISFAVGQKKAGSSDFYYTHIAAFCTSLACVFEDL